MIDIMSKQYLSELGKIQKQCDLRIERDVNRTWERIQKKVISQVKAKPEGTQEWKSTVGHTLKET